MRRSSSALTTAILGAAIAASTVSAQQQLPSAGSRRAGSAAPASASEAAPDYATPGAAPSGPAAGSDPIVGMAATRGARYLLRNGLDYINYQEYERALKYLREAEVRQKELSDAERLSLKQAIERAQRGLREAVGESPYALSRRPTRAGGFAVARPSTQVASAARRPALPPSSKVDQPVTRAGGRPVEAEDRGQPIQLAGAEIATPAPAATAPTQDAEAQPLPGPGPADAPRALPEIPTFEESPAQVEPTAGALAAPSQPAVRGPEGPTAFPPVADETPEPARPAPAPVPSAAPAEGVQLDAAAAAAQADLVNPVPSAEPTPPAEPLAEPAAATSRDPGDTSPTPPADLSTPAVAPAAAPVDGPETPVPADQPPQTVAEPKAEDAASTPTPAASPEAPVVIHLEQLGDPKDTREPAAAPRTSPAPAGEQPADPSVRPAATEPEATPAPAPAEADEKPASPPPSLGGEPGPASAPAEPRAASAPASEPSDDLPPLPPLGGQVAAPEHGEAASGSADRDATAPAVAAAADAMPPLPSSASREAAAEPPAAAADELPALPGEKPADPPVAGDAAAPKAESPATERLEAPAPAPEPGPAPSDVPAAAPPVEADPAPAAAEPVPAPSADAVASPAAAPRPEPEEDKAAPAPAASEPGPAAPSAAELDLPADPAAPSRTPQAPPASGSPGPLAAEEPSILPRRQLPPTTLHPELRRQVEEVARLQEEEARRNQGRPAPPNGPASGPAQGQPEEEFTPDRRAATATQVDISRAPSPAEARPIRAIPVPDDFVPLTGRDWTPQRKYWAAAATCHLPLYFQDPMLERYGHSVENYFGPAGRFLAYPVDRHTQSTQRNQIAQPFFSAGLFAWQIISWPYALVVDPPWEAQYDLGYWRPGDKIPTDLYYQPLHGTGPPLRGMKY